jgi:hemerythrin superfamily protein
MRSRVRLIIPYSCGDYVARDGDALCKGTVAMNSGQNETRNAEYAAGDALVLLMNDHRQVETLFQEYENADADHSALVLQICMALDVHARVEEEIFYPEVQGAIQNSDLVSEALAEHASVKQLIAQILQGMQQPERLGNLLTELRQQVMHHVQEEESELFPEVEASGLDLNDLGRRLTERKIALMHQLSAAGA